MPECKHSSLICIKGGRGQIYQDFVGSSSISLYIFRSESWNIPVGIENIFEVLLSKIRTKRFFRILASDGLHLIFKVQVVILSVPLPNPNLFGTILYAGIDTLFSSSIPSLFFGSFKRVFFP